METLKEKIYNDIEWDGYDIKYCNYTFPDGMIKYFTCQRKCPFYDRKEDRCDNELLQYRLKREKLEKIRRIVK